jgi:hypothetical protein
MSELSDRMELIQTTLAAAFPLRVVTRDLLDFSQREHTDLEKGIWTLVSSGERGYKNYSGREGMDGVQPIMLVGQFVKPEETLGSVIEDAELDMVDEIKTFLRARPAQIIQLYMTGFRQSRQLDAPYGWVSIDLEFLQ